MKKNKKISKIVKGLLCVMMVGVVLVASGAEPVKAGWEEWLANCIRKPEYEDAYAKLWYTMTYLGPNAITQSKYSYGNSTDAYVTYINNSNEIRVKEFHDTSYNADESYLEAYVFNTKGIVKAQVYFGAYRLSKWMTCYVSNKNNYVWTSGKN